MFGTPPDAGESADNAWAYLRGMYEAEGARDLFDGVASHPYAANMGKVESQVELLHDEIVRAEDSGAGLWVTELGWASSGPDHPLNRGPEGQAERLTEAFDLLLDHREDWNVESVIWYSWRDFTDPPLCDWCGGSGPVRRGRARSQAVLDGVHRVHRRQLSGGYRPPAIAGRMTTVSESETPVSRPSRTRTSSSLR